MNWNWEDFFTNHQKNFAVIAGPCAIESKEQFLKTAEFVKEQEASFLRGGVYKLRTSPDTFQGLGQEALEYVKLAKEKLGMSFVAEITDPRQIEEFLPLVDMIQVGSRNMYNYSLLKELGSLDKAVFLKRGFSATLDEWIKAGDYVRHGGNPYVILCERGIRGFDSKTRNVLDLGSVTYLKQYTDHIVYVDPSHATGDSKLIPQLAKASVLCGADGLMIEVHPNPASALSDGPQALNFDGFANLMSDIKKLLPLVQKELFSYSPVANTAKNLDYI